MGYLVSIIGNSGVGKTTLAGRLAELEDFFAAREDLTQRPFQSLFAQDLERYALANQVDFMLYRAEQERFIRGSLGIGLQDGGLDLDFQIFTRLFHHAGYLNELEFDVCDRLFRHLRQVLPPPDLMVYLKCPIKIIAARYQARGREREIAQLADLRKIQNLLESWLKQVDPEQVITVDASQDRFASPEEVERTAQRIKAKLPA